MIKKKEMLKRAGTLFAGMFFIILFLSLVCAVTQPSWPSYNVCCEKTKTGAWCQNTLQSGCDISVDSNTKSAFRMTPTSCDATSFCKPGCCIDTGEGLCMENTPQRVCQQTSGTWVDDSKCNIQQCSLGCCILGDQASFITLTRCKKLSAFYGLTTNFKRDVTDETSCILLAQLEDKGACVYEVENMKTCKFTTRAECLNTNRTQGSNMTSGTIFYKDYLCSADTLGTNCGPTTQTTCIEGKDEVFFVDTCGNTANIYDASKTYDKDNAYWQKIVPKASSCNFGNSNGNIGSKTCGNCEYFRGSICGKGSAVYGSNICKDLNCYDTQNGKNYKNGESWCIYQGPIGNGRDLVGSRQFRHICINGEEIVEACADFRNEVCIQNTLTTYAGNFIEAACRPNRWKDCLDQTEKNDCLNKDKRDCYWSTGAVFNASTGGSSVDTSVQKSGGIKIIDPSDEDNANKGICMPNYPPGFSFWNSGTTGDASNICNLGSIKDQITFEKGLIGGEKCTENCEMLTDEWANKMNNICTSLGDCGDYFNVAGVFTDKGVVWKVDNEKKVVQGILDSAKSKSSS